MDIGFTQTSKNVRWRVEQMDLRGSQITDARSPGAPRRLYLISATEDTRHKIQDYILPYINLYSNFRQLY